MWRWLRRLLPQRVALTHPRTVTKRGAVTETRTGLAVHFHFNGAPPRAPKAPRPSRRQPKGDNPLLTWLFGPKAQPLTTAQVRALPLVRQPSPQPDPVAAVRTLTGQAFPTKQDVERVRAAWADEAAIAARAAQLAKAAQRKPGAKRTRKKAGEVAVEAHTRDGKPVAAHTRKKPQK